MLVPKNLRKSRASINSDPMQQEHPVLDVPGNVHEVGQLFVGIDQVNGLIVIHHGDVGVVVICHGGG
jgi:hypothetical protein